MSKWQRRAVLSVVNYAVNGERRGYLLRKGLCSLVFPLAFLAGFIILIPLNQASALHKVDHRFTVTGRVCDQDGQGRGGVTVSVKDTRSSVTGSSQTDANGRYKALLHLHSQNQGDPLLISALQYKKEGRATFDPHNIQEERMITVNLGGPCKPIPLWKSQWVYYGVGTGMAGVAGLVGVRMLRGKHKKPSGKGAHSKRKKN